MWNMLNLTEIFQRCKIASKYLISPWLINIILIRVRLTDN